MSDPRPISIVHLTVRRDLTPGTRNQILYEHQASGTLEGATWTSVAVHTGKRTHAFEHPIPAPFRSMALRGLYGWLRVLRLSREHDYVLLRHMPFDPYAFIFAPLVRNRLGIHHSKEIEELPLIRPGLAGRAASLMERVTGRFAVRRSAGILGVTDEIARYEHDTRAKGKRFSTYYNAIDLDTVEVLEDRRQADALRVAFVCSTFSAWHGLDRLLDAVVAASAVPDNLRIDLVGTIPAPLQAKLASIGERARVFTVHGRLGGAAYRDLLAEADVSLGSLAMDRQNLREGTTLKVREMLAMGLPLYSGHRDSALPADFPYYRYEPTIDIARLVEFARDSKRLTRAEVRAAATPFISKRSAMQSVVNWLRAWPEHA